MRFATWLHDGRAAGGAVSPGDGVLTVHEIPGTSVLDLTRAGRGGGDRAGVRGPGSPRRAVGRR